MPNHLESRRRARAMHEHVLALLSEMRAADFKLFEAIVTFGENRHHRELGYVSLAKYASAHLGWSASKTSSAVTIWAKLPDMPHLRAAFAAGKFGWSKAYLIATNAKSPEDEAELVAYACEHTDHELKVYVARRRGEPVKKKITLELDETYSAFVDQVVARLREIPGNEAKDVPSLIAEALKLLALGGVGGKPGEALVVMHVCAECKKGTIEGRDGPVVLPLVEAETLGCCAAVQDLTNPEKPGKVDVSMTDVERRGLGLGPAHEESSVNGSGT